MLLSEDIFHSITDSLLEVGKPTSSGGFRGGPEGSDPLLSFQTYLNPQYVDCGFKYV